MIRFMWADPDQSSGHAMFAGPDSSLFDCLQVIRDQHCMARFEPSIGWQPIELCPLPSAHLVWYEEFYPVYDGDRLVAVLLQRKDGEKSS